MAVLSEQQRSTLVTAKNQLETDLLGLQKKIDTEKDSKKLRGFLLQKKHARLLLSEIESRLGS